MYALNVACHSCTEMETSPNISHHLSSWYSWMVVHQFRESSVHAIDVGSPFQSVADTLP